MSKFRYLNEEETKVLLQVTEWLDNHFFSPKKNSMKNILRNT